MVVYFDDILVYNQSEDHHFEYITQVIKVLEREKFYHKFKKFLFHLRGDILGLRSHSSQDQSG